MAGGIAAGALGSSGLLGAAAPLTVERPRSGGKPEGATQLRAPLRA